jgi:hypothetical protein
MRTRIKSLLIDGYCRGWIPAWVVTLAFRVLRLRSV